MTTVVRYNINYSFKLGRKGISESYPSYYCHMKVKILVLWFDAHPSRLVFPWSSNHTVCSIESSKSHGLERFIFCFIE